MPDPYLGEIRMFAGNFAPIGWAFCDGSILPISGNEVLFNLIGTTYGGDGQDNFQLPDLRGRVPIHQGQGAGLTDRILGSAAGQEAVALSTPHLPAHSHPAACGSAGGNSLSPAGRYWATDPGGNTAAYSTASPDASLSPAAIAPAGAGLPHPNLSPFTVINYIVSLSGVYPSQG